MRTSLAQEEEKILPLLSAVFVVLYAHSCTGAVCVASQMRLLTHNQLTCAKKECSNAFPLKIAATKVEQNPSDCNQQFIAHIITRVDYPALLAAASQVLIPFTTAPLHHCMLAQSSNDDMTTGSDVLLIG